MSDQWRKITEKEAEVLARFFPDTVYVARPYTALVIKPEMKIPPNTYFFNYERAARAIGLIDEEKVETAPPKTKEPFHYALTMAGFNKCRMHLVGYPASGRTAPAWQKVLAVMWQLAKRDYKHMNSHAITHDKPKLGSVTKENKLWRDYLQNFTVGRGRLMLALRHDMKMTTKQASNAITYTMRKDVSTHYLKRVPPPR